MNNLENNVNQKYTIKSEIEHILDRSGMWLGSLETEISEQFLYVPTANKIKSLNNVAVNPALLKLIDEILSNSVDEFIRKDSLFQVTEIDVEILSDGQITIRDNGGITSLKHTETNLYIPELIFGQLRSSSNYDDTKEREVVGTNGLGAKLTNIFSKEFIVTTADGKNKIICEWRNNMSDKSETIISKSTEHFTETKFKIDLDRFNIESLDMSTIRLIHKRCIDAAAANIGLKISFRTNIADGLLDSVWKFDNFIDYIELFDGLNDEKKISDTTYLPIDNIISFKDNKNEIYLVPILNFPNITFINGAICCDGTHIKKIQKQVTDKLTDYCTKNNMELITEKDINNRYAIFGKITIANPKYDSQTKDKLTNKLLSTVLKFDNKFIKSLETSYIYNLLVDYYEHKYAVEKRKETKKLNTLIKTTKIKKLIQCGNKTSNNNELFIFEGNSAAAGFKAHRTLNQAAYLLRGKIKNTFNLSSAQITENLELRELLAIIGLQFDEPQKNLKNCKFGKIIICTDADYDGSHISGLLLAFLAKHFPELIKANKIYRALSPIIICNKGKESKYFYTLEEYENEKTKLKGWSIIYTKGLGGLSNKDYSVMLRQQKLIRFNLIDDVDYNAVQIWFDKSTTERKELLVD